jgi:ATP-binding cassette, subfamily A (ABC1), member 3
MAEGQLRCAGSALFLKKHYGVGYQLTIEKNQGGTCKPTAACDNRDVFIEVADDESEGSGDDVDTISANLERLIKSTVPQAKLLNDVGTEVRYQLPLGASDQFASMFEHLDAETEKGSIVSYGVSMTTLGKCLRNPCFRAGNCYSSNLDTPTQTRSFYWLHVVTQLERTRLIWPHHDN